MTVATVPRNNVHIWRNWSAVPRIRVLFDRWGYDNRQVFNYLVNRFGWTAECDVRDLQFQVSQAKCRFKSHEKVWRVYVLLKEGRINDLSFTTPQAGRRASEARGEIESRVKSRGRIPVKMFKQSLLKNPPRGYALKWVFKPEGSELFYCPPIGEGWYEFKSDPDVASSLQTF